MRVFKQIKKLYISDIQPPCLVKIYDTFYEPFNKMYSNIIRLLNVKVT